MKIQNEESVILFLVVWTVTEITRYSYYTFNLLHHLPYFIKWARWRCHYYQLGWTWIVINNRTLCLSMSAWSGDLFSGMLAALGVDRLYIRKWCSRVCVLSIGQLTQREEAWVYLLISTRCSLSAMGELTANTVLWQYWWCKTDVIEIRLLNHIRV